mgnify:FL=1
MITRYGVSDIIISSNIELPKYVNIYDKYGKVVDNVEIYFIEKTASNYTEEEKKNEWLD